MKNNIVKPFSGRVIFDHLEKTAGQAINEWLRNNLGDRIVTSNLICVHEDAIRRYSIFPVISGHLQFRGEGFNPIYDYITLFRHPLDRALSWLYFIVNNHKADELGAIWHEAKTLLDTQGNDIGPAIRDTLLNPYVRHLVSITDPDCDDSGKLQIAIDNVQRYRIWGLYEDLPLFLQELASLVHLPCSSVSQFSQVNKTKKRVAASEISGELRANLTALLSLDWELYAYLCKQLHVRQSYFDQHIAEHEHFVKPLNRSHSRINKGVVDVVVSEKNNQFKVMQNSATKIAFNIIIKRPAYNLDVIFRLYDVNFTLIWTFRADYISEVIPNHIDEAAGFGFELLLNMGFECGSYHLTADVLGSEKINEKPEPLLLNHRIALISVTPADMEKMSLDGRKMEAIAQNNYIVLEEELINFLVSDKGVISRARAGQLLSLPLVIENKSMQTWWPVRGQFKLIALWFACGGEKASSDEPIAITEIGLKPVGLSAGGIMHVIATLTMPEVVDKVYLVVKLISDNDPLNHVIERKIYNTISMFEVSGSDTITYTFSDFRMKTQSGSLGAESILQDKDKGYLVYGPYESFKCGEYMAALSGVFHDNVIGQTIEAVCHRGSKAIRSHEISEIDAIRVQQSGTIHFCFSLEENVEDLEVRFFVNNSLMKFQPFEITSLRIDRLATV